MKKRIILCMMLTIMIAYAHAQVLEPTAEESEVLLCHKEEIDSMALTNGKEAFVELCLRYYVPKAQSHNLKSLLLLREKRKAAYRYIYPDAIQSRVESKLSVDSIFQDSIDAILIPHNKISGENISFAVKCLNILEFDDTQRKYIINEALDIAHQIRKDPGIDVWNREMDVIKKTFTKKQLDKYFTLKNGKKVTQILHNTWNKLSDAGLTAELDSTREWSRAYLYYTEQLKMMDLYKNHRNVREKALADLARHMPQMVRMYDAMEKKKRIESRKKEMRKEYVW